MKTDVIKEIEKLSKNHWIIEYTNTRTFSISVLTSTFNGYPTYTYGYGTTAIKALNALKRKLKK